MSLIKCNENLPNERQLNGVPAGVQPKVVDMYTVCRMSPSPLCSSLSFNMPFHIQTQRKFMKHNTTLATPSPSGAPPPPRGARCVLRRRRCSHARAPPRSMARGCACWRWATLAHARWQRRGAAAAPVARSCSHARLSPSACTRSPAAVFASERRGATSRCGAAPSHAGGRRAHSRAAPPRSRARAVGGAPAACGGGGRRRAARRSER